MALYPVIDHQITQLIVACFYQHVLAGAEGCCAFAGVSHLAKRGLHFSWSIVVWQGESTELYRAHFRRSMVASTCSLRSAMASCSSVRCAAVSCSSCWRRRSRSLQRICKLAAAAAAALAAVASCSARVLQNVARLISRLCRPD